MRASSLVGGRATVAIVTALISAASTSALAQTLIVGNDEKPGWDENGKQITREPGHDTLSVIDISKPESPQITATIPLINSIAGPPTNLAVSPSGDIALVANSLEPVTQGWAHRLDPDNKVFLIDLKAAPPKVIGTITVGKQPSGIAISPKGDLALVANRADGTISVLSIRGKDILVVDTVTVGTGADQVSAVAITPDGKRALAVKAAANKVALLSIDGEKVTYDKRDLPARHFPLQHCSDAGRQARAHRRYRQWRELGRQCRYGQRHRSRSGPAAGHRSCDGRGFARGSRDQPKGRSRHYRRGTRFEHEGASFHHPSGAVTALKIDGKKVPMRARSMSALFPRAGPSVPTGSTSMSAIYRRGFVGLEGGRNRADRYRAAHQITRPSGIDAGGPAIGCGERACFWSIGEYRGERRFGAVLQPIGAGKCLILLPTGTIFQVHEKGNMV